jgi:hypothetical protein
MSSTNLKEDNIASCSIAVVDDFKLKVFLLLLLGVFIFSVVQWRSFKMRSAEAEGKMVMCCASCGIAGVDDIKLKACNGCKSIQYCSVKCQRGHRPQHRRECQKRAAELRDEILFKQPESSYLGDCPICCLPLSLDHRKSILMACCSKLICQGCDYANQVREVEGSLERRCAFCRNPMSKSEKESIRNRMKRVAANDPVPIRELGKRCFFKGDYNGAIDYWTKAAELGDIEAHYSLSILYRDGKGVEKDEKMQLHHAEVAAIGGHPKARHSLGNIEMKNGRLDRSVKHWIIAANLGLDESMETLKECYPKGIISKEDFASALRGHQTAVNDTKSPQREAAVAGLQKIEAAKAVR